ILRYLNRVLHEILNNIVKHAQAYTVEIVMCKNADEFALYIEDDGIGILNTESHPGRYGLASMQERVRRYDGQLEIHSPAKKGVRLEIRIPLVKSPTTTTD